MKNIMPVQKSRKIHETISFFATLFTLMIGLCSCGQTSSTWQEQYDLGVRYLSEGDYEEAIIAFTAAIEIDPKRAEAYFSLAEVYVETGDAETAILILKQGYEATGESSFTTQLDKWISGQESAYRQRISYISLDGMEDAHQEYIFSLIDAVEDGNRELIWDLLQGDSSISNWNADYAKYGKIYTEYDEYRICLSRYSGNSVGSSIEMRQENGIGYYCSSIITTDPDVLGGYNRSVGEGRCEGWNWNGEFQIYEESSMGWKEETTTQVGQMLDGLFDGTIQTTGTRIFLEDSYSTPAGTVEAIDFSVEYANGVRLDGGGAEGRVYGNFGGSYSIDDLDSMLLWSD